MSSHTDTAREEQESHEPTSSRRVKAASDFVFKTIPKSLRGFFKLRQRAHTTRRRELQNTQIIDSRAPAKVQFGNGEFVQVGLEVGPDGDTLEIARRPMHNESAAVKIQSAFRRYKARALYESLQTLDRMNLELKWPDATPFIGLLIVRVRSIENLHGVRTAFVRAKFDGDVTSNVAGQKDKNHTINYTEQATFVNIVVRSNSVMTLEVMQSLELAVRVLGKVQLPVSSFAQGTEQHSLPIRSTTGEEVGIIKLTVGYRWLRGTTDFGGYSGPEILVMSSRKIRGTAPGHAVERLWKVNHWVCSHDNVWCTTPEFADIVREAVKRERNKSASYALYGSDGELRDINITPATTRFKDIHGEKEQPNLTTAELLNEVCDGFDFANTTIQLLSESSVSTAMSSSIATLGNEDWTNILDEATRSQRSDKTTSTALEEEINYDYSSVPPELIDQELTDATSQSSVNGEEDVDVPQSPVSAPDTPSNSKEKSQCVLKSMLRISKDGSSKRMRPTTPSITGKFEYGAYRPASDRGVHIFASRVENTADTSYSGMNTYYMGEYRTSKAGRIQKEVPRSISCVPGHYSVMAMLPDDNTFGHGSLFMLERGTKCVIFDLDGTITTSDVHVVAQTLLDSVSASTVIGSSIGRSYDIRARNNALMCVRAWAAKGYQVVYLSGRQGSAYNMTLDWLIKHGYPPGPIHLTRTHLPTLPVYVSVGHFKIKYMEELRAKGLELFAAYGNTGTDIKAYEKVGIPKERTFIVGANGGKKDTQCVKDFTSHLTQILTLPDSDKPLPYIELLRSSPVQVDQ